jgi:phage-related minor tail protein
MVPRDTLAAIGWRSWRARPLSEQTIASVLTPSVLPTWTVIAAVAGIVAAVAGIIAAWPVVKD